MQTLEDINEGYQPTGLEALRRILSRNFAKIVSALTPGDWQIPGLNGGWIGLGGSYQNPRYRKLDSGLVTIEGAMQHTSSDAAFTAFTLLPGFRPAGTLIFYVYSAGGACRVDVNADGTVVMSNPNHFGTSFAGIHFYAA